MITATSIFTVTDYKSGRMQEVEMEGVGQETIRALRKLYPRHTKFVLEGFEIDGNFVPLYIKSRRYD